MNPISPARLALAGLLAWLALHPSHPAHAAESSATFREISVTNHLTLPAGASLPARLIVRASHVTIDGAGATLVGPGAVGDTNALAAAGIGVLVEDAIDVTITNLAARGFATGLLIRRAEAVAVRGCDFSDNYHNPGHGWGELPARGGVRLEQARHCVLEHNRANRVWDGLNLIDADDNLVADNDFSECSNTCAKLWHSSRNRFLRNRLAYGLRIDRAAGEVHARDSTGVLIETGSDDNYWYRNDVTHGGDGIFIRPLNRWVSRGNVFVENDTSYANNNCVESWSPGNTFIRNRANHGSYGFWLGGSDQTVLIGNEAAFNGLPDGFHNAPEPGFGHGGIVIVGGPSSHCRIEGNLLHHNHGGGLVFRGDTASRGAAWRTTHWVVQENTIVSNRFGLWGRWGEAILLAGNVITNNAEGDWLDDVTGLIDLGGGPGGRAPEVGIDGPAVVRVGETARFQAAIATPGEAPRHYRWWLDGAAGEASKFERVFTAAGFQRLSLTIDNGARASMAWRDVLVVESPGQELGTDGPVSGWQAELEGNTDGRGRVNFALDPDGLLGRGALRFSPDPYPGAYVTVTFPGSRDARWNFAGRQRVQFWLKARNPNIPGWQNAGPVVRLLGPQGSLEYLPAKDANRLNDPPFSEARWSWMPVIIPLTGDSAWTCRTNGTVELGRIDAISLALDSWGGDPFTVWVDGLEVK